MGSKQDKNEIVNIHASMFCSHYSSLKYILISEHILVIASKDFFFFNNKVDAKKGKIQQKKVHKKLQIESQSTKKNI